MASLCLFLFVAYARLEKLCIFWKLGLYKVFIFIKWSLGQSMTIFIAIYRLASISRVLRHIVVLVSHCGGKFGTKYCWCCIGTSKLFEIFCVDFVGVSGSCCILRIYETRTEFVISAHYLKDLGFSNVLHSLIRVEILQYLSKS